MELVEDTDVTVADAVQWNSSDAVKTKQVELKRCLTWYCDTLVSWFGFGTAADTDSTMLLWYHQLVPSSIITPYFLISHCESFGNRYLLPKMAPGGLHGSLIQTGQLDELES